MKAWRRGHPNATAAQVDAKAAHVEALNMLGLAEKEAARGNMPSRMVEALRRREVAARTAWDNVDPDSTHASQRQKQAPGPEVEQANRSEEPAERKWTPASAALLVPVPDSSDAQCRKAPPTLQTIALFR